MSILDEVKDEMMYIIKGIKKDALLIASELRNEEGKYNTDVLVTAILNNSDKAMKYLDEYK